MKESLLKELIENFNKLSYEEKKSKIESILIKYDLENYKEIKKIYWIIKFEKVPDDYLNTIYSLIIWVLLKTNNLNKIKEQNQLDNTLKALREKQEEQEKKDSIEADKLLQQVNFNNNTF